MLFVFVLQRYFMSSSTIFLLETMHYRLQGSCDYGILAVSL